jgi:hypothetical protein
LGTLLRILQHRIIGSLMNNKSGSMWKEVFMDST